MSENPPSLRQQPRRVGEVMAATLSMYRAHFRFLLVASLCFLVPFHILDAYAQLHLTNFGPVDFNAALHGSSAVAIWNQPGIRTNYVWLGVLVIVYSLLVTPLLNGMIVYLAARENLYRQETSLNDASSHALHRLLPCVGTLILEFLLYFAGIIVFAIVLSLLMLLNRNGSVGLGSTIGVVMFIVFAVTIIWWAVKVSFVPSVVFAERKSMFRAIGRSFRLTGKNFWRLFGFYLLIVLIFGIIRSLLVLFLAALLRDAAMIAILATIIDVLVVPYVMLATANMYCDLFVRDEMTHA